MKADKWVVVLLVIGMAVMAATGSIGCLVSGFQLDASVTMIAVVSGICATAGILCFRNRRLAWLPLVIIVAVGILLWRTGPLNRSAEYLIHHISSLYNMGYHWGVIRWSNANLSEIRGTVALCFLGAGVALAVVYAMLRRGNTWLGVGAVVLPVLPCIVLTDTVPGVGYLILELFVLTELLLTQTVRVRDTGQGNRLTLLAAVPIAVAFGMLFLLCPQDTYSGQQGAEKMEQLVTQWFGDIPIEKPEATLPFHLSMAADVTAEQVKLDDVGPQNPGNHVMLKVEAQKTGTLYLRGCAYDVYDGFNWMVSGETWALEADYAAGEGEPLAAKIVTNGIHDVRYFGYVPTSVEQLKNGRIRNNEALTSYIVAYIPFVEFDERWDNLQESATTEQMAQYLQLPTYTLQEAKELLRRSIGVLEEDADAERVYQYARTIATLVRNSADYDLNTASAPEDAKDFALWFLQESDTGYCVHYATAATVLLRAAGIPARYVTGYLVDAEAGVSVNVRSKDAHAWVECYINGAGWIMLEPTASGGSSPVILESQQQESTGTVPPETMGEENPSEIDTVPEETSVIPTEEDVSPTTPQTQEPGDSEASIVPDVLLWLSAFAAVIGQWRLRVWLRKERKRRGKPNARALYRWQEAAQYARLLRVKPDEQLHVLAQKAKFSNSTLTAAELRVFDVWLENARQALKKRPVWMQLLYTLVFAMY